MRAGQGPAGRRGHLRARGRRASSEPGCARGLAQPQLPLLNARSPTASLRAQASYFLSFFFLESFCSKESSSFWMTEPTAQQKGS